MGLQDLVRSGVALANRVTKTLQATVAHEAFKAEDQTGQRTYYAAVQRTCVIEWRRTRRRTQAGDEIVIRPTLLFLSPVAIDTRDRITLPDGTTGPIADVGGVIDPDTGTAYTREVTIG